MKGGSGFACGFRSRTLVQVNRRIDNDSNLKPPGAEGERRLGGYLVGKYSLSFHPFCREG